MSGKPIRIVLAESDQVIREALKLLLQGQPDLRVVGEAAEPAGTCRAAVELRPDVLVFDDLLQERGAVEMLEHLHAQAPDVRPLVVTVRDDEFHLRRYLQAGIRGYVLRRTSAAEFLQAIRTVAAGAVHVDRSLTGTLVHGYLRDGRPESSRPEGGLSGRETEVLRLMAWGYANKEIAARLAVSVKTVETYKARLMSKLALTDRPGIVRYAMQQGWMSGA